jgi:hypothetical protein
LKDKLNAAKPAKDKDKDDDADSDWAAPVD